MINVAIGVVTGLVQEFQFGMNWSAYSRLVGNIFGAPLAMEGLLAFFLESTFLGLWVFGWEKLSRRLHLLSIWAVAVGAMLSAAFILAANSWMQHPVGYTLNRKTHLPQLNDIWAVLTNPVFVWGYAHIIAASLVTGAAVMLAVSAWQLRRGGSREVFTRSARLALAVLLPSMLFAMLIGSELGVIEGRYQPMKIAAAEAQWTTCQPCSFSVFQIGGGNNDQTPTQIFAIPHLLSLLATNHWDGKVIGLNPLQSQYSRRYGAGYYVPNVFIQYWSMRIMAYTAGLMLAVGAWGLWLSRRRKLAASPLFLRVAIWAAMLPFAMNTAGWLLTESGRQPWVVQGIMLTRNGGVPVGPHRHDRGQPGHLRAALRGPRRGGPAADAALRAQGAAARGRARRPPRAGPARRAGLVLSIPFGKITGKDGANVIPLWFILITVLWTGFFVLEGFDFGVGMLHGLIGRDEAGRATVIATIGPLWDGNEVWLVVAAAAMFAAFPAWYATMFSGFYLVIVLMLAALIVRGVAFEFRGKRESRRWRRTWDRLMLAGSLVAPFLIGLALADLLHGVPIEPGQEFTGSSPACSRRTRSSPGSPWWRSACCTARASSR